jgi:hypothetical protein
LSLKALFLRIWETRPHVCALCGRILREPRAHNFSHRKHRGMGGKNRKADTEENIDLLCYACHYERDHGVRPHNADWLD